LLIFQAKSKKSKTPNKKPNSKKKNKKENLNEFSENKKVVRKRKKIETKKEENINKNEEDLLADYKSKEQEMLEDKVDLEGEGLKEIEDKFTEQMSTLKENKIKEDVFNPMLGEMVSGLLVRIRVISQKNKGIHSSTDLKMNEEEFKNALQDIENAHIAKHRFSRDLDGFIKEQQQMGEIYGSQIMKKESLIPLVEKQEEMSGSFTDQASMQRLQNNPTTLGIFKLLISRIK
jgi:hypothetical protein